MYSTARCLIMLARGRAQLWPCVKQMLLLAHTQQSDNKQAKFSRHPRYLKSSQVGKAQLVFDQQIAGKHHTIESLHEMLLSAVLVDTAHNALRGLESNMLEQCFTHRYLVLCMVVYAVPAETHSNFHTNHCSSTGTHNLVIGIVIEHMHGIV